MSYDFPMIFIRHALWLCQAAKEDSAAKSALLPTCIFSLRDIPTLQNILCRKRWLLHKSSPARALERAVLCADAHTHLMGRAAQAAASWVGAAAPGGGDEDGDVLELRCTSISYIKCQRRRPPLTHTLGHEVDTSRCIAPSWH